MEQNLITYENVLKDVYLPLWQNQLFIDPSAFLAKIKKVPLAGEDVVAAAPYGLSGGFGFGEEGKATPIAGPQLFERFREKAKDMYTNVEISIKATRLTDSTGAMADALDTEVKAAYDTAKWNIGRALFGNGTGILTTIQALGTAGNTITVADTTYLQVGLIIDIYATGGTIPQTNGKGRRIVAVNRAANTIVIDGEATSFQAGFITVQNSYNNEITGLGAIYDDSITSLYGVQKSANPIIKPTVVDAENDISDRILINAARQAQYEHNAEIDMILCGNAAYDTYTEYLRTNNIRVESKELTITGGFNAIELAHANRKIAIVNEPFVPTNEMWGVDTSSFELHTKEWEFANLNGSSIFTLVPGTSVYRALLNNFGNLICKNPGGCFKIKNVG